MKHNQSRQFAASLPDVAEPRRCLRRYRVGMVKHLSLIFVSLSIMVAANIEAAEPVREQGISVHALPKRVAKLSGTPWGFEVSYAPYLKPEPAKPYLQSVEDVLSYVRKQDPSVIANGFWVVTSHPAAYDSEETELQQAIKEVLPKEGIALFWVRGAELENGFTRY